MDPSSSRHTIHDVNPFDPFRSVAYPAADLARKTPGYEGVQRMDLVPVAAEDRFRIDDNYDAIMQEKERLIASTRDYVYQVTPEALVGSRQILSDVISAVCRRYPERFSLSNDSLQIQGRNQELRIDEGISEPLLTLARVIQEDITLLHRDSAGMYRLAAGCVCFPSHWSLRDKMGKTVQEIHAPVPELNARIGGKIDALLERLSPERPMARVNFLINFNPRLSQIPELELLAPYRPAKVTAENIGEVLWLRNEYETLSKLPCGDIIFTLKTYQTQLKDVAPLTAKKLADMHRDLPEEYRDKYRKLSREEHELLLAYLDTRAS